MSGFKVTAVIGSLRKTSINLKLVQALARLAEKRLAVEVLSLADLPMYNEDLFTPEPPDVVTAFKTRVADSDAVLFAMPEYNRSVPGVLKNAVDWGSRPYGKSIWPGKPAAIVGSSPGAIGSAVGQSVLRNTLVVLEMELMGQPEVYVKYTDQLYAEDHAITDDGVQHLLTRFVEHFAEWIERRRKPQATA